MRNPALSFTAKLDRAGDVIRKATGVESFDPRNLNGPLETDLLMSVAGIVSPSGGDPQWAPIAQAMGLGEAAGLAEIGEALRKAAVTTGTSAAAMLTAQQSDSFIVSLQERDTLSRRIRIEPRDSAAGSIEKIGVAVGKIRAASENADDGYRAEPTFGTVPYQAVGVRLPFEITMQFLRYNVEGETVEDKIWNLMMRQFGIDLGRLDLRGDTASADPSLSINDGWLKQIAASAVAHRVNGGNVTFGSAWPNKAHLFAALEAMPDRFKATEGADRPVFVGSPTNAEAYQEYLSDRASGAGDRALTGAGDSLNPLGYEFLPVPFMPNDRLLLTPPQNLVRVLTTAIERYRVGPETDWELATRRKRGYVFFVDHDSIVEEMDAVVDVFNLGLAV